MDHVERLTCLLHADDIHESRRVCAVHWNLAISSDEVLHTYLYLISSQRVLESVPSACGDLSTDEGRIPAVCRVLLGAPVHGETWRWKRF
ncbi:hypothetical protein P7K49_005527 [Saguinus oedipus]|uniref:Uncharacterized protein n=1 Tax=Saguinus oedipus TaxID=9490 RepID=A0ABQ9VZT8_SAGOE|nr:hypothetical protein P7K49_005527 [Saguinus oedipus]